MHEQQFWSSSRKEWINLADMDYEHLENAIAKYSRIVDTHNHSSGATSILAKLQGEMKRRRHEDGRGVPTVPAYDSPNLDVPLSEGDKIFWRGARSDVIVTRIGW
jgi:hypothetical protein